MIPPLSLSLTKGLGPALNAEANPQDLIGSSLFDENRDFPQLSLDQQAIEHNIEAMMRYVRARGIRFAPHGKTAMSPQLAEAQMAAGAWAITAATPTQLRVYRSFGFQRLLLANQLVEPGAIAWLRTELAQDETFSCFVYADSVEGLELLAAPAGEATSRPIEVLLEVGHAGGRTGTRGFAALEALAAKAAVTPGVRIAGVAAYEGTLGGPDSEAAAERVLSFARELGENVHRLKAAGLLPSDAIVSIGGSAYFAEALDGLEQASFPADHVVLRSGAYLTHDSGFYEGLTPLSRGKAETPKFLAAIRVWAPIISIPEPGFALVLCGRRDVGFDQGLPGVLSTRLRDGSSPRGMNATVTELADQHAFISFDPAQFNDTTAPRVGDLVELGISHPCTTLDRWSLVPLVDERHTVRDLIRMYFS
ncbi:alanine racemase [Leucobacter chinensis]|uniref:alanine racemase n=1 Tax=Leucobacter chinensis TaxID=2851010 RepID=UPI001C2458CC|nr:alanine racemase [Leucobacter chinensis]